MFNRNIITSDIKSPMFNENSPMVTFKLHERNGNSGLISGNIIFAIRLLESVLIFVSRSRPINILNMSCSVANTISLERLSSPGLLINRYITKLITIIIVIKPIRFDKIVPPRGRPQEYISFMDVSWLLTPPSPGSLLFQLLRYFI
jgi:hypothetical protein